MAAICSQLVPSMTGQALQGTKFVRQRKSPHNAVATKGFVNGISLETAVNGHSTQIFPTKFVDDIAEVANGASCVPDVADGAGSGKDHAHKGVNGTAGRGPEAFERHCTGVARGEVPSTSSRDSLSEDLGRTETLLSEEMLTVSAQGDTGAYLALYNRLVRLGRLGQAVVLLQKMDAAGLLDTDKIYHGRFLKACKQQKAVRLAFPFVKLVQKPTLSLYNQLLSVCTAARDLDGALRAFKMAQDSGLQPDCPLYTSLIAASSQVGKVDFAFKVFHEMEANGLEPNLMTFAVLIDSCSRAHQLSKAFGVYGILLTKNLKPDQVIFNALISACGRAGAVERAFDVLQDMKQAGVPGDAFTVAALVDACSKAGQTERALGVLQSMQEEGIQPPLHAYTAAVQACTGEGSVQRAKRVLGQMKKQRVRPDEGLYAQVIKVAAEAKDDITIAETLHSMRKSGLQEGNATTRAILSSCRKMGLPERALEQYKQKKAEGVTLSLQCYNEVLETLCAAERLEESLEVAEEMRSACVGLNRRSYGLLIAACERDSKADLALKLYHAARMEGVTPDSKICHSIISLCYDQIKKQISPPLSVLTVGQPSFVRAKAPLTLPHQQWVACAITVYLQALAAGVVPKPVLLSKLLGCLRVPEPVIDFAVESESLHAHGFARALSSSGGGPPPPQSLMSELESIYDHRALAIYEEAARLGVVPRVDKTDGPLRLDLTALPSHAAEVCILALTRRLHKRQTENPSARVYLVAVELAVESLVLNRPELRRSVTVQLAGSTGQAVAALLRRLDIRFQGPESRGKLRILAASLQKRLRNTGGAVLQPEPVVFRLVDPGAPEARLAKSIAEQQRAIRMGEAPPFHRPHHPFAGERKGPPPTDATALGRSHCGSRAAVRLVGRDGSDDEREMWRDYGLD